MPYHASHASNGTWIVSLHLACLHLATPTSSIESMQLSGSPSLHTTFSGLSHTRPSAEVSYALVIVRPLTCLLISNCLLFFMNICESLRESHFTSCNTTPVEGNLTHPVVKLLTCYHLSICHNKYMSVMLLIYTIYCNLMVFLQAENCCKVYWPARKYLRRVHKEHEVIRDATSL